MSEIDDILKDALAFDVDDLDLDDDDVDLDIGDLDGDFGLGEVDEKLELGGNFEIDKEENNDGNHLLKVEKEEDPLDGFETDFKENEKKIEEKKVELEETNKFPFPEIRIEEPKEGGNIEVEKSPTREGIIDDNDGYLRDLGINLDDFDPDSLVKELSQRSDNPENEEIEAIVQTFDIEQPTEVKSEEVDFSEEEEELDLGNENFLETPKFILPVIDHRDDIVIEMKKDFQINEIEIKNIVKERFLDIKETQIKKKFSLKSKKKKSRVENSENFSCLNILNSLDEFNKEKLDELEETVEKRKNDYFSSLQEGEWASNHQDISPIEVELSKNLQEMIKGKHEGKIISFASSLFSSKQCLFGTKKGEILEVILTSNKVKKYSLEGEILTCDICFNDSVWAAGSSKSQIIIKKSFGGWSRKTVPSFNSRPIIQLRFIEKNQLVIATDTTVSILILKDLKYTYDLKLTKVVEKKENILQVMFMPILGTKGLLIVAQLKEIYFCRLDCPENYQTLEKPAYIEEGYPPVLSWVIQESRKIRNIIVFWKNLLLMMKENDSGVFEIIGQKSLEMNVRWGTVLGNRIVCMIDDNYEMQLQSVEYLFASFSSGGGFGGAHQLPKERLLDSRIVSIRKDGGFIRSSVERIRCLKNSIGFLSDKGLYKAKLLSIQDLCQKYIEKGKWLPALRLCVEVYKEKIVATKKEKEDVNKTLPDITLKYVDNFMKGDKSDKSLMESITKVSIEAMFETGNLKKVFSHLEPKIGNSLVFWKQVEMFVLNGKITNIPPSALVKGSIYLQSNTLQLLLLEISISALKKNEEAFHQILMFIKKRKLWLPYIRLGLNIPKLAIKILLSSLMIDMMNLKNDQKEKQISVLRDIGGVEELIKTTNFGESNPTTGMYRIFWFLRKIVNTGGFEEKIEEENTKYEVWTEVMSWFFEDKNSEILCQGFPQLYFEILYDVFLNHEIMMFKNEKIKIALINIYSNWVKREKTRQELKSDEEFLSKHPKWFIGNSEEALKTLEMSKVVLLLVEAKLMSKKEFEPWTAFFFLKILNISMFASLFQEKEWVDKNLRVFLSSEIKDYWMYYKSAELGDIEEQVVRVLKKVKYGDEVLEEYGELAKINKYNRIYAYILDILKGPVESLKTHVQNAKKGNLGKDSYIFRWLGNQFDKFSNNSRQLTEFSKEVTKILQDLIDIDLKRAREVIIKLPSMEKNDYMIRTLEPYPDLLANYIENMLDNELKDREHRIESETKLSYLRLKCENQPDQVVKVFNRYKFPLDESLKICKEYKNSLAIAYITNRLGLTEEAVDEYLELIGASFEKYLGNNFEKETAKKYISDAQFSFQMVLSICMEMADQDEEEAKNYFEKCLNSIVGDYLKLGDREKYKNFSLEDRVKIHVLAGYIKTSFIERLLIHYAQRVGTNEICYIINNNENMNSLQLSDYKGIIQYLGFERKMMSDIDFVCRDGHHKSKKTYVKKRARGGIKSNLCSVTQEKLERDCMVLPCAHPVDLLIAKTRCNYPKEFKCQRCPEEKFVERKLMSRIYKLEQKDIKNLALQAMKEEVMRIEGLSSVSKDLGFINSEQLDVEFDRQFVDVYEMVTLDSIC